MTWICPVRQSSPGKNPVIDNIDVNFILLDLKLDHIQIICNSLPETTGVADILVIMICCFEKSVWLVFIWLIIHADWKNTLPN